MNLDICNAIGNTQYYFHYDLLINTEEGQLVHEDTHNSFFAWWTKQDLGATELKPMQSSLGFQKYLPLLTPFWMIEKTFPTACSCDAQGPTNKARDNFWSALIFDNLFLLKTLHRVTPLWLESIGYKPVSHTSNEKLVPPSWRDLVTNTSPILVQRSHKQWPFKTRNMLSKFQKQWPKPHIGLWLTVEGRKCGGNTYRKPLTTMSDHVFKPKATSRA